MREIGIALDVSSTEGAVARGARGGSGAKLCLADMVIGMTAGAKPVASPAVGRGAGSRRDVEASGARSAESPTADRKSTGSGTAAADARAGATLTLPGAAARTMRRR
jgi:hypothetical protein